DMAILLGGAGWGRATARCPRARPKFGEQYRGFSTIVGASLGVGGAISGYAEAVAPWRSHGYDRRILRGDGHCRLRGFRRQSPSSAGVGRFCLHYLARRRSLT